MSAYTLAIANQKGGVGKTTTAVALAAALADRGQRVLLIDCDPQGSATAACGLSTDFRGTSLYDLLGVPDTSYRDAVVAVCGDSGAPFDLIPANIGLSAIETEDLTNPRRTFWLLDVLTPALPAYDWLLLDCPPTLGSLLGLALAVAHGVLIPVVPDFLSVQGMKLLKDSIHGFHHPRLNMDLQALGVVLTKAQARAHHHQEHRATVRRFASSFDLPLFETEIPASIRAPEAAGSARPLPRWGQEPIAVAYRALAQEVLARAHS